MKNRKTQWEKINELLDGRIIRISQIWRHPMHHYFDISFTHESGESFKIRIDPSKRSGKGLRIQTFRYERGIHDSMSMSMDGEIHI
jgi:hypothetical protein